MQVCYMNKLGNKLRNEYGHKTRDYMKQSEGEITSPSASYLFWFHLCISSLQLKTNGSPVFVCRSWPSARDRNTR